MATNVIEIRFTNPGGGTSQPVPPGNRTPSGSPPAPIPGMGGPTVPMPIPQASPPGGGQGGPGQSLQDYIDKKLRELYSKELAAREELVKNQQARNEYIDKALLEAYRKEMANREEAAKNQAAIQDRIDQLYLQRYREALANQQKQKEEAEKAQRKEMEAANRATMSQFDKVRREREERLEEFRDRQDSLRKELIFERGVKIAGALATMQQIASAINQYQRQAIQIAAARIRANSAEDFLEADQQERENKTEAIGKGAQIAGGSIGFAIGGPIGAAIGIAGGSLIKEIISMFDLSEKRFLETFKATMAVSERVAKFSPQLSMQRNIGENERFRFNLQQAEKLGPGLVQLEEKKQALEMAKLQMQQIELLAGMKDLLKEVKEKTEETYFNQEKQLEVLLWTGKLSREQYDLQMKEIQEMRNWRKDQDKMGRTVLEELEEKGFQGLQDLRQRGAGTPGLNPSAMNAIGLPLLRRND